MSRFFKSQNTYFKISHQRVMFLNVTLQNIKLQNIILQNITISHFRISHFRISQYHTSEYHTSQYHTSEYHTSEYHTSEYDNSRSLAAQVSYLGKQIKWTYTYTLALNYKQKISCFRISELWAICFSVIRFRSILIFQSITFLRIMGQSIMFLSIMV